MTNLPQVFNGNKATIILRDEEPWWVAKEVCNILGYSNNRDALKRHCDDFEKGVVIHDTPGGKQEITVINESGLYSLIFGSKLPDAKKFKRWVTDEVLPAIRKSGNYGVADTRHLVESVAEPLKKENEELKSKVIALLEEKIARQEKDLKEVKKSKKPAIKRKLWNALEKAEVMRLREAGYSSREIAMRFAVTRFAINDVIRRVRGQR
jgi:prophage antirepressor-like protein